MQRDLKFCGFSFYQSSGKNSFLRHFATGEDTYKGAYEALGKGLKLIVDGGKLRSGALCEHGVIVAYYG